MRAGAREFLTLPLLQAEMADALERVSTRRSETPHGKRTLKNYSSFWAPKAAAVSPPSPPISPSRWPRSPDERTLLIDFGLPLGDVAHQPRDGRRVLHRQRAAGSQPAGCQLPPLAAGKAQLGISRAPGAGRILPLAVAPPKPSINCWPSPGRASIMWSSMPAQESI